MHNGLSATGVLAQLIYILESNLSELVSIEEKDKYVMGSWDASIECLEIIGRWSRAKDYGLDYNPEIKFDFVKPRRSV